MTQNNNLSVLPFYTDIALQNHRKDYAFGEVFPLLTLDRRILPFQIIRPTRVNAISSAILKTFEGSTVANITSQLQSGGMTIRSYPTYGYDLIVYPGLFLITAETPEGRYYLQITDGVDVWYSEIFTVVRSLNDCLKISWRDSEDLIFDTGRIDFSNSFSFYVYLPTQVGKPDYEFEEQVENRDGFQFIEKQISEKTYKFNFLAPEYLLDAMRIIRMMDIVRIVSKGVVYDVDQFLMTPKWEKGGYLAAVEVEFQCNTVIKKIGKVSILGNLGDFNDDFNEDFNT